MSEKERILIVDDDESTRRSLELILEKKGYETEQTATGREAMEKIQERFFNVAILDIKLPDADGVELAASLKQIRPDTTVIMATAFASVDNAVRALNSGASAYITKPINMEEMLATIRSELEKQFLVFENRRLYEDAQKEIAKRKQLEEQLAFSATHDPLTGLPNRRLCNDHLSLELVHARRNQQKLAIIMLDLDRFKDINDRHGHTIGDKVLCAIGTRLSGMLRKSDTVARIGGDEFIILSPELKIAESAGTIAGKILAAIRKPLVLDEHELHITGSIGVAIYPDHSKDIDTLLRNADRAMYNVKQSGRDNYQFYTTPPLRRYSQSDK